MKPAWVLLWREALSSKTYKIVGVFYSEPTPHGVLRALCDVQASGRAYCKTFDDAHKAYSEGLAELVETNCLDE